MDAFIYQPEHSVTIEDDDLFLNESRELAGKQPYGIIRSWRSSRVVTDPHRNILQFVKPDDKLYISAHGNARGIGLSGQYTPAKFAQHLEEAGLKKNFRDLRIFSCRSADRYHHATIPGLNILPYAQELKRALRYRGYALIRVSGYLGLVYAYHDFGTSDNQIFHKATQEEDGTFARASSRRVEF